MNLAEKIYNNLTPSVLIITATVFLGLFAVKLALRLFKDEAIHRTLIWLAGAVYLAGMLYITLFSREQGTESTFVISPLFGYKESLRFDPGFIGFLKLLYHKKFSQSLDAIHIISAARLEENFLNILLFVPFGYIFPSVIRYLRNLPLTLMAGFTASLAIETTQLFTGMGIFDVDDLLNNTAGAVAGYILFFVFIKRLAKKRDRQNNPPHEIRRVDNKALKKLVRNRG